MATFYYSHRAQEDLFDIVLYIALDNIDAAERVEAAIEESALALAENPLIGHELQARIPELMMFPVTRFPNYLLFYTRNEENIIIQRILHGARDLDDALNH